ncbi:MAG: xanthine dehydrogenase family protein subunit M [Candidatus Promineifilaceae bacterium]|nr:xanthine dehydrogenase family protein subunit M [Candidatus Promineifilaceae bacterium]
MKPAPFEYVAPRSLEDALSLMAEHGDEAKLLAGGQSLVPAMNFRLLQPTILVDLNRLEQLAFVQGAEDGGLRLGALTRQREMELNSLVAQRSPLMHEALPYIAHVQIRNRGTLGGSLAHADPAGELPVLMVALRANLRLRSSAGDRWVNAEDYYQGLFMVDMKPEEILVEVSVPPPPARTGWCFVEFARRQGDYALLGVAAQMTLNADGDCQEARLVYLNAGEKPVVATRAGAELHARPPSAELFEEVAHIAAEQEIQPSGDIHASVPYLRHLAVVLTRKALGTASERALAEMQPQ